IVTYSHALDLELCHRLLLRGFGWLGLIGSATKWARFRSRLRALGHLSRAIDRITCPIGDRGLGKLPQAIAIGVAAQLLKMKRKSETEIADDGNGTERGGGAERPELLKISGVTKAYPGVVANSDVGFTVGEGEVHALLGENGAGKSTLVKMIYGLVRPDSGTMRLDGAPFAPHGPVAARAAGVGMVFQHFSLFEALSVAENIELGMADPPRRSLLAARIREVSAAYGLPLDPDRLVGDLSVGVRQRVEIVRCLLQGPKLLIMDEPTSVLTPQEVELLFATLRKLRAEGVSILYISHKLDEIRALCDRATILRGGKVVATCTPAQETARSLAEMMIGQALATPPARTFTPGAPVLELAGLGLPALDHFGVALRDIRFTL